MTSQPHSLSLPEGQKTWERGCDMHQRFVFISSVLEKVKESLEAKAYTSAQSSNTWGHFVFFG